MVETYYQDPDVLDAEEAYNQAEAEADWHAAGYADDADASYRAWVEEGKAATYEDDPDYGKDFDDEHDFCPDGCCG